MTKKGSFKKVDLLSLRFLKCYLRYFLPAFSVFLCMIGLVYVATIKMEKRLLEKSEAQRVKLAKGLISDAFLTVHNDLRILSEYSGIAAYLSDASRKNRDAVTESFTSISKVKTIYDQIRLLDSTGMERIRVNYSEGQAAVVPEKDLQDKSGRYYFADTLELAENQSFISPFDLNVEGGTIEKPQKPILRFGTPVYDRKGQKKGILVLNYLGRHLLGRLERMHDVSGRHLMLLNSDGYWLKGRCPEDEWGFMYDDRKQDTCECRAPEEWDQIANNVSGQFRTDRGLITFSTVYPLREIIRSDTVGEHRLGWLKGKQYSWKVVSQVDQSQIDAAMAEPRRNVLGFIILMTLCVAIGSGEVAFLRARQTLSSTKWDGKIKV